MRLLPSAKRCLTLISVAANATTMHTCSSTARNRSGSVVVAVDLYTKPE